MGKKQDIGSRIPEELAKRLESTTEDGRFRCFCGYVSSSGNPQLLHAHINGEIKVSLGRGEYERAWKHRQFYVRFKGETQIRRVFTVKNPKEHPRLLLGLGITLKTLATFVESIAPTDSGPVQDPFPYNTPSELAEEIRSNANTQQSIDTYGGGAAMATQSSPQRQHGQHLSAHSMYAQPQLPVNPQTPGHASLPSGFPTTQSYGGNAAVRLQQNQGRPR